MNEIKCPNCGQVFQVDESGYAAIVRQVRDKEFANDVRRREQELLERAAGERELERLETEKRQSEALTKKDAQIAEKERLIDSLRAELKAGETDKKLAVEEALRQKEREQEAAMQAKKDELAEKEREIEKLRARVESGETDKNLAVMAAEKKKDEELFLKAAELTELKSKLEAGAAEARLREQSMKESFDRELRLKDTELEYYKDFKARQSTKMVGESLEQHCMNRFNSIRMTAFPNAYFEKDNDARTGSKGDFIFREEDGEGGELISIMFEMKNE
ncbi:MAG: DUF2130 domain-containing protein, partial [Clostridia bacterium]|nr:DUF2130 domain-containing protein [Clostridia bacterium]